MRKMTLFIILIGCMLLTGCSSGNKKSGEEIQKKIEKTGWEVKLIDSDEERYLVNFIINQNEKIILRLGKQSNDSFTISYAEGLNNDFVSIPYDNKKAATQHVVKTDEYSFYTCSEYNLEEDKESDIYTEYTKFSDSGKCTAKEVERLKQAEKRMKELVHSTDITYDDIILWSEWKYNIKNPEKE